MPSFEVEVQGFAQVLRAAARGGDAVGVVRALRRLRARAGKGEGEQKALRACLEAALQLVDGFGKENNLILLELTAGCFEVIKDCAKLQRALQRAVVSVLSGKKASKFLAKLREKHQPSAIAFVLLAATGPLQTGGLSAQTSLELLSLCRGAALGSAELPDPPFAAATWRQELAASAKLAFEAAFAADPCEALEGLSRALSSLPVPLVFVDSVRAAFAQAPDDNQRVLALKCLTVLTASTAYELEAFYHLLYELLQQGGDALLACERAAALFQVLEVALRSERLPAAVVRSFAKLLLRRALAAASPAATFLAFLLFNAFKKNEQLRAFLARRVEPARDPFDETAPLFANGIEQSGFWEVGVLQRHVLGAVRTAFDALEKHADSLDFVDLDVCAGLQTAQLLQQRLDRQLPLFGA